MPIPRIGYSLPRSAGTAAAGEYVLYLQDYADAAVEAKSAERSESGKITRDLERAKDAA
jgi:hypothetical protein